MSTNTAKRPAANVVRWSFKFYVRRWTLHKLCILIYVELKLFNVEFFIATVTKPTTKPATIKPATIKPTTTTEFSKLKEDVANLMKDGRKICFF